MALKTTEAGTFLYIATSEDVLLYNLTHKDRESRSVLDTIGATKGLAISPINHSSDTHFVTGQNIAIFCYNPEGRGQCYAFEGKKRLMYWYRGYLTTVSDEGLDKATITIFDVQNKFIGFTAPIKPILAVVSERGSILLVTQEGKLHQLLEKDTQSKLAILFRKNFYDVAVKIARNQQYDAEGLVDIFRQYGDHLYAKGDQTGAIEQYIKTIGTLEPSYVIQKFLDAQKIHNLTAYLQALHRKGLASEDHTTLLLNCYTKLKDSAKLDEFIMTKDREVDFDVDIAITVCRQAGYHRHAMALASKHGNHDLYLAILVEEEGDQEAALKYISSLPLVDALLHARKYGPGLMHQCPAETTALLKRLCVEGIREGLNVTVNDFIPLFISDCDSMVDFLGHLASSLPPTSLNSAVLSTLLEYRLYSWQRSVDPKERKEKEREVMELLMQEKGEGEGDESNQQALILCQRAGFTPGLLHLYQQAGLYDQILNHHLGAGNWEAGLQACRRFGPSRPQLWVTALQQVAACGAEVPPAQFREVLDQVERHKLLSPLQVVSTLSSCPTATLGVVRDYLLRTIDLEEKSIAEDRKVIDQYQQQSKEVRAKIDRLNGQVTVFQSTKCSVCGQELELPTVHFLCGHGFHQHCFQSYSESDSECPICYKENKKILDMVKSQEAGRNQHDQFHAQLEKAEDGFGLVAEYFGRGLFSSPLPVPTASIATSQFRAPQQLETNIPQTEGRLRLETRGGQGIMAEPTEARMRAEAKGGLKPLQSEARLRAGEQGGIEISSASEARLRSGERNSVVREISEGRMRAETRGGVGPMSVPSEGRLRASAQGGSSISQNLSQSPAPKLGPMPTAHHVPRREDIQAANPFGSPSNPFGSPESGESPGEGNPFASSPQAHKAPGKGTESSSQNPLGEDDEYDSSGKNPFAD